MTSFEAVAGHVDTLQPALATSVLPVRPGPEHPAARGTGARGKPSWRNQ